MERAGRSPRPLTPEENARRRLLYVGLAIAAVVFTGFLWGWSNLFSANGLPGLIFMLFFVGLMAYLFVERSRPAPA
jgi:predicted tellurium resistance membrane protein TerC